MEIRAIVPRENYFKLIRYYYFQRNLPAKIVFSLCISGLISFNMGYGLERPVLTFVFIFIILIILSFVFLFLIPYLTGKRKTAQRLINVNQEILNFSFKKEGFNIQSGSENYFIPWTYVQIADIFQKEIFLKLYNKHFYLFPSASFTSDGVKKDFLNNIKNQILIHRPANTNSIYRKGWLGLIPIIGAFVGIWLIVEGVTKYKDRKLIFIGIGSVLFTLLIYGSFFYYGEYSKQYRIDTVPLSKYLLNKVVIDIEFYKSQKGFYPDSLEDLQNADPTLFINDPIMQGNNNATKGKFYYKKLGNNYTLFSCGVDKIPFTPDDIYPSTEGMDPTKIGLIKKR